MTRHSLQLASAIAVLLPFSACNQSTPPVVEHSGPTETADAFVARLNTEMTALGKEQAAAGFAYNTYVTVDTEFLNAKANERYLEYFTNAVEHAKAFENVKLSPIEARALKLLKLGVAAPAPRDPAKRAQLTALASKMEGAYASAKYCPKGPESCKDETALSRIMANSHNYDELVDAWSGWHATARQSRADYTNFVALANEGAREL